MRFLPLAFALAAIAPSSPRARARRRHPPARPSTWCSASTTPSTVTTRPRWPRCSATTPSSRTPPRRPTAPASRARRRWPPTGKNGSSSNSDAKFEAEDVVVAGNRVTVQWIYRKTRDGKPWHLRGIDLLTVRDGKIAAKLAYVKG